MMTWHYEDARLVLRTEKRGPIAMVMTDMEDGGFCALILEPGFPSKDGFDHAMEGVLWVEMFVVKHLDPDAKFGPVPKLKGNA
jgi:hypothetical protein